MELEKVYIDETMGEAQMEFYDDEHILKVYENKQSSSVTFDTQFDGQVIDVISLFYTNQELSILKIERETLSPSYAVELERGNAYYYITSDLELDEFEEIIQGIFFETV